MHLKAKPYGVNSTNILMYYTIILATITLISLVGVCENTKANFGDPGESTAAHNSFQNQRKARRTLRELNPFDHHHHHLHHQARGMVHPRLRGDGGGPPRRRHYYHQSRPIVGPPVAARRNLPLQKRRLDPDPNTAHSSSKHGQTPVGSSSKWPQRSSERRRTAYYFTDTVSSDGQSRCSRGLVRAYRSGRFYTLEDWHLDTSVQDNGYQSDTLDSGPIKVRGQLVSSLTVSWKRLEPVVECGDDAMFLNVRKRRAAQLRLDTGNSSSLALSQLSSECGYSVNTTWKDLLLVAAYNACHVTVQDAAYVLPLLWRGSHEVKMSCPVVPLAAHHAALEPLSLCCSAWDMTVTLQGRAAEALLRVKVRGSWTPVVSLAQQCGYSLIKQPGVLQMVAPFSTCGIAVKDGKHTLYLQIGEKAVALACPIPPPDEPLSRETKGSARYPAEERPPAEPVSSQSPMAWGPPFYLAPLYHPHPTRPQEKDYYPTHPQKYGSDDDYDGIDTSLLIPTVSSHYPLPTAESAPEESPTFHQEKYHSTRPQKDGGDDDDEIDPSPPPPPTPAVRSWSPLPKGGSAPEDSQPFHQYYYYPYETGPVYDEFALVSGTPSSPSGDEGAVEATRLPARPSPSGYASDQYYHYYHHPKIPVVVVPSSSSPRHREEGSDDPSDDVEDHYEKHPVGERELSTRQLPPSPSSPGSTPLAGDGPVPATSPRQYVHRPPRLYPTEPDESPPPVEPLTPEPGANTPTVSTRTYEGFPSYVATPRPSPGGTTSDADPKARDRSTEKRADRSRHGTQGDASEHPSVEEPVENGGDDDDETDPSPFLYYFPTSDYSYYHRMYNPSHPTEPLPPSNTPVPRDSFSSSVTEPTRPPTPGELQPKRTPGLPPLSVEEITEDPLPESLWSDRYPFPYHFHPSYYYYFYGMRHGLPDPSSTEASTPRSNPPATVSQVSSAIEPRALDAGGGDDDGPRIQAPDAELPPTSDDPNVPLQQHPYYYYYYHPYYYYYHHQPAASPIVREGDPAAPDGGGHSEKSEAEEDVSSDDPAFCATTTTTTVAYPVQAAKEQGESSSAHHRSKLGSKPFRDDDDDDDGDDDDPSALLLQPQRDQSPLLPRHDEEQGGTVGEESEEATTSSLRGCTEGQHVVFGVPDSVVNLTVSRRPHRTAGQVVRDDDCTPRKLTSDPNLYAVPLEGCGIHTHVSGQTVVYLLEVQGLLHLGQNHHSDGSPVRLMVECWSSPGSPRDVRLQVMCPSSLNIQTTFPPPIQATSPPPPPTQTTSAAMSVQLRLATDASYSGYHPDVHLPLSHVRGGGPLYVEVVLLNPPPSLQPQLLLVHYCLAYTYTPQPTWMLLYDRCLHHDDSSPQTPVVPTVTTHPDNHTFRLAVGRLPSPPTPSPSYLDTSKSTHLGETQIYFWCSVEVCSGSDVRCSVDCRW